MTERPHLPLAVATGALARCVCMSALLLARRRIRQPREHVGQRLHFSDGTAPIVYRETVVDSRPAGDPAVLVVGFRLRGVRGWGHTVFRCESLLNTPLFVGFPGFVSKLWLTHDGHGLYRGLYEWDGQELAESYVRALWWVLALVSDLDSIHYEVLPGLGRDEVLRNPDVVDAVAPGGTDAWWRLTSPETLAA
jgi:hypothetical protein